MRTKAVSTPVIIAALIITVLLAGFLGWRYLNGPRLGADGEDISRAGVQPSNMSYGAKPTVKPALKPAAKPTPGASATP